MLLTMFARWSRAKIAPLIATARERGEPRPYVAVTGAVLLVVAVVELRFRR